MTIDTRILKRAYDLRTLVEQDLGPSPVHSGRAHLYKCPFHNEQKGFSLAVWSAVIAVLASVMCMVTISIG